MYYGIALILSSVQSMGIQSASATPEKSLIMAAEAPDPKTFGSWEEAFQFPVSTVRAMEGQLRRNIDLNRERLRSLVGYERDP